MTRQEGQETAYFPFELQVSGEAWEQLGLASVRQALPPAGDVPRIMVARQVASRLNRHPALSARPVPAGQLNLYILMLRALRHMVDLYTDTRHPALLTNSASACGYALEGGELGDTVSRFVELFPPAAVLDSAESPAEFLAGDAPDRRRRQRVVKELLLLRVATENRALDPFRLLFDDGELALRSPYRRVMTALEREIGNAPADQALGLTLAELLRAPLKASPDSLAGQLEYIRSHWEPFLPPEVIAEVTTAFGIVAEETRPRWEGAGPPQVLEFGPRGGFLAPDDHYPEPERFSADVDWMPNVVLIAKMVYVWLGQLAKQYGREVTRLDQIPDEELDLLARRGFTGLWLIGIWERSASSQRIKRLCGNPEAISSAYSLFDYTIAADLGGWEALGNLRDRALQRGIRLASDMVPNHTGIYSKWTMEHPDWFIRLDYPPFPTYTFNGPDLSSSPEISLHIEDGYWDKRDAAVVFKHYDHRDGRTRYIYHGNDGTSTPWNDTAQLDYLNPEVREAVIRTILHVAHHFPIIRFDAAMTLAKKHYQRLWFPQPGLGSGVPSRAEHGLTRGAFDAAMPEEFWRQVVDRVAAEAPDTLLLAEAFWLMEGYFVRTLGMHRVYNSAFMNMLKLEENAKYRQTIKNVLEFNPEILKRFVNFMNNPDERTAVEQFGKEKKYLGAAVLLVTMPGLPMFGHGQVEGYHEKYGMEYRRAYWDEPVDEHLVAEHERLIFPLVRRRRLFSGSEGFILYDFFVDGVVNEDVFAYSNRFGDERGIVLYHNRYAATAGWIRSSTARAVSIDSGETVLAQTTLGEALGFNPDGRYYYVFRDYATGLEYIRHGRELCEKGMYVELEAYEYHAFLDFREIRDDDFGTWGALCFGLEGRGAPSIDEEVKLIRFAPLVEAFRGLFTGVPEILGLLAAAPKAGRPRQNAAFAAGVRQFAERFAEGAGSGEEAPALVEAIDSGIGRARRLVAEPEPTPWRGVVGTPAGQFLLLILVVLGGVDDAAAGKGGAAAGGRAGEFGLLRALNDVVAGGAEEIDLPWTAAETASLMAVILRHRTFFAGERESVMRKLLADRDAARFLGVHASGGVRWFVKERFEELLAWLTLAELVTRREELPARRLAALTVAVSELAARAAAGGYRVDHLLEPAGSEGAAAAKERE
ncbi:alpha-amylase family glycosyl hydrolase [Geobacter pickeringii]|uniref:Alpha-amylase n=1 Tax=Geobacter pickeringii TaxID=345632 RepID=A0A0B5BCJ0_9BACT|nr:alpha-amylase family glycosyl hydrolase [Geobacter pickeringii]AJE04222.1 alpha-amylase [Geobacter pickeringii]